MRNRSVLTYILAPLLAGLCAFAGFSCLATGFALPDWSFRALLLFCLLSGALFSLCSRFRLGWLPLCAGALLLGFLWNRGGLGDSLHTLLSHISEILDRGYGWGVIAWERYDLTSPDAALYILGAVQAAVLTALLLWGKQGWLPLTLSALPLASCLILTDTLPSVWALAAMLIALLLMLLTRGVSARSPRQGNRLLLMLLLPVTAAVLLLLSCFPEEQYRGREWVESVEAWVQSLFEEEEPEATLPPRVTPLMYPQVGGDDPSLNYVDLQAVGPRAEDETVALKVTAPESGYIYLRGSTYNYYTGTTWMHNGAGVQWPEEQFDRTGALMELEIDTQQVHGLLYTTYNPTLDPAPTAGRIVNTTRRRSYTVKYLQQPQFDADWAQLIDHTLLAYDKPADHVTCLNLPQEASNWAGDVLHDFEWYAGNRNYNGYGTWALAHEIAEYVALSTQYDLDTPAMPRDEKDFASWFMQESPTGYCVHFATAAAVLLRQAGIPARYVTGYLVEVKAEQTVLVRQKNAHAWVEYFVPGIGWMPLEATPGYYQRVNSAPEEEETPEPTEPTQPETTAPPEATEPTQPETTAPPVTTRPTTQPEETTAEETLPVLPTQPPDLPPETEKKAPLLWILGVLLVLALLTGQWRLRVFLRHWRRGRGDRNTQCLRLWKEAKHLCRLQKQQPPEEIRALALQARFGPKDSADAAAMEAFVEQQLAAIKAKATLPQKLWYTLVLSLY